MPLNTNRKSHEYPLITIYPHFCSENQRPRHVFCGSKNCLADNGRTLRTPNLALSAVNQIQPDFDFQGIKGYGALTWFNHEINMV